MLESLSSPQLATREAELTSRLASLQTRGQPLNIARGRPSLEQLDLANPMLALPGNADYQSAEGIDCRSYGGIDGLPEMKQLFGGILNCPSQHIVVGGNSSLAMMHDALVRAYVWGTSGGDMPWREQGTIRFLCPSPGYDRHFLITELFGFEMLPVEITSTGPNMDQVESLAMDPSVKGIWCVPRYSNPTGVTYSDSVVERLAHMKAAPDFRIFWDNAYAEHHLLDHPTPLANILATCIAADHADRVLMFASTSKMSFAGGGVAAMGASAHNITDATTKIGVQTIGPDKLNQLRQLHFFKDLNGLRAHMRAHARILKPKFDLVEGILQRELGDKQIAHWSKPAGGYFVNLDVPDGCARQVIALTAEAGVTLTPAGASFPHGLDPNDRNIRIAPTFPALKDLRQAIEILTICVELVAIRQRLQSQI
jgi:aspartate/methionine/tyrosine aminotransferase